MDLQVKADGDFLTINGVDYNGTTGPVDVVPGLGFRGFRV